MQPSRIDINLCALLHNHPLVLFHLPILRERKIRERRIPRRLFGDDRHRRKEPGGLIQHREGTREEGEVFVRLHSHPRQTRTKSASILRGRRSGRGGRGGRGEEKRTGSFPSGQTPITCSCSFSCSVGFSASKAKTNDNVCPDVSCPALFPVRQNSRSVSKSKREGRARRKSAKKKGRTRGK